MPLPLSGAFVVESEVVADSRGYFARTWCRDEFARHGLIAELAQCSVSHNGPQHTLRGMHYQAAPHQEVKLVRCLVGSLYDVIVDLQLGSPTFHRWTATTLRGGDMRAVYVPEGFAHGFLTLEADTTISYLMSRPYHAAAGRGIRYDDPVLDIEWPAPPVVMSDRDRNHPPLHTASPG